MDFRKKKRGSRDRVNINGVAVELVSSRSFLGTHISEDVSWSTDTSSLAKKTQQLLFFLRLLKKILLSKAILENFYRCTVETILTNYVTVWYGAALLHSRRVFSGWGKPPNTSQGLHL